MRNKAKLAIASSILATTFMVSCSKKLDSPQAIQEPMTTMVKTSYQELGYSNQEDMLKNGWKVLETISLANTSTRARAVTESTPSLVLDKTEVPVTLELIKEMGYDIYTVEGRAKLKSNFIMNGVGPDGLSFGANVYIQGSVVPTVAKQMGLQTNVTLGTPEVIVTDRGITEPDDVFKTEAINNSDTESKVEVDYAYQKGYKTTWQSQVNGSLKVAVSGKVGIPLVAEGEVSTEVLIGGATTNGTEDSEMKTQTSKYTAVVPAHSKKILTIITKRKKSNVTYKVPMWTSGSVGVNFPVEVNGHYYYSMDAALLMDKNLGKSTFEKAQGIASVVENLTVQVIESPATKL